MPIFQIKNNKTTQVQSNINYFRNEAELRDFFAENLEDLLGMRFLEKEYPTTDGRMDTIALDENNSPVIIEYKWGQDNSIFTQGLFYYDWLKKNKKHLELLVGSKLGEDVKVNWNKPRVILVAQGFDNRTIVAVQQVDYVELIKYVPYKQDILYLENIYSPETTKSEGIRSNKREAKRITGDYDIEYHLSQHNSSPIIKDVFYRLQEKIKSLPDIDEVVTQKTGITYRTTKSFTRLEFGRGVLYVLIKRPDYDDPKQLIEDVTSHEWGYKGRIKIRSIKGVDDVFEIVKQSYEETL